MKKLFCRLTFAFVLFGLSGTYMFANENAKIEPRASYVVPESGSWIYKTEGQARAEHTSVAAITRGKGNLNYYFKVFIRDERDGIAISEKDVSNGTTGTASLSKSSSIYPYHNHTATGMLMW